MPISVPMAGKESGVKVPRSATISVALDARLTFRYQLLASFVRSPKDLYFGLFSTDGGAAPFGTPQNFLNGMRMFLSRSYSEHVFVGGGGSGYEDFSESQSINPSTFVKTPPTIVGKSIRSQIISEDPEPGTIKEMTHGRFDLFPPEFYDETRGDEFNYQPTFDAGLAFLNSLDYATQWTGVPSSSPKTGYTFAREGSGFGTSGAIVPATSATMLPQTFTRANVKDNPVITESAINIGTFIIPGVGQVGGQFIMNRQQVRWLTKGLDYFCCQRIGSKFKYLPGTQGKTVVGDIFEIPPPDFTDIPKLVNGSSTAAYEFATLLVVGKNFNSFVQSVFGTVVSSW